MATFDVKDFLHPLDLSARQQLEKIPLLQVGVKKYLELYTDRRVRQGLLSQMLRLGPDQLSDIYRHLPPICDAFGIPEPELYLTTGDANAMTVGHTRTAIIIQNKLLEDLSEDEIVAVLAHECGHVLANHLLFRQMAQSILNIGSGASLFGGALVKWASSIATKQIESAMINWYQKSELTADRAAVAYLGGPEPMQRALFRVMGVPRWIPGNLSYTGLLEQAAEFDELTGSSKWERYLARGLQNESTHPNPVLRMRELTLWAESSTFRDLMGIAEREGIRQRTGCTRCGHRLAPQWQFCQRCGAPVVRAEEGPR